MTLSLPPLPKLLIPVIAQKKQYQCWSEGVIGFTVHKVQAVQVSVQTET